MQTGKKAKEANGLFTAVSGCDTVLLMPNQKGFSVIFLVVLLVILGSFTFTAYYLGSRNKQGSNLRPSPSPSSSASLSVGEKVSQKTNAGKCEKYGIVKDKEKLYRSYTTKKGDTLKIIARDQLGDVSRASELYYINSVEYPSLVQTTILKAGSNIYLPPDYLKKMTYMGNNPLFLYSARGEVVDADINVIYIKLDSYNAKYGIKIGEDTQFIDKSLDDYKVGDCLEAIMTEYEGNSLAIFPQSDSK